MRHTRSPLLLVVLYWSVIPHAATGQWTWNGLRPSAGRVSAAFSPDGRTLAVLDGKDTVYIWDVASGKQAEQATLKLKAGEIPEQVCYTSYGDVIVLSC